MSVSRFFSSRLSALTLLMVSACSLRHVSPARPPGSRASIPSGGDGAAPPDSRMRAKDAASRLFRRRARLLRRRTSERAIVLLDERLESRRHVARAFEEHARGRVVAGGAAERILVRLETFDHL